VNGKLLFRGITLMIAMALLLSACQPAQPPASEAPPVPEAEAEAFRVALILPGRADDLSWNQAAYEGMNKAVESMSVEVELRIVEQVYDPVDIEAALRDYAQQGFDLIIGHGFQFMEPIVKVAEEYPDINFAIGTGYKIAENVGVYDVKLEEGGYLMGMIAGTLTETNIVGQVGGVDVAEIHRGHAAFKLGAETVNPDVRVLTTFVGDFNDLAGAKEAGLSQIDAGADMLWTSGDGIGLAVINACEERDLHCMGNVANQIKVAPETVLASYVYDWSPLFVQMMEETLADTYGNEFYWIDLSNEGVYVLFNDAMMSEIPAELQAQLEEAKNGFVNGTLDLGDLDAMTFD
jgi:basic membrane protein A and related proteins